MQTGARVPPTITSPISSFVYIPTSFSAADLPVPHFFRSLLLLQSNTLSQRFPSYSAILRFPSASSADVEGKLEEKKITEKITNFYFFEGHETTKDRQTDRQADRQTG